MKIYRLIFFAVFLLSLTGYGQNPLPPTVISTPPETTLTPGQVPTIEDLKKMGATEAQIRRAMEMNQQKASEAASDNKDIPPNSTTLIPGQSGPVEGQVTQENNSFDTMSSPPAPQSKIYGHDFLRNKSILVFERASDFKAPENYTLSGGDEISVAIWGFADFNQVFKIDENGAITAPNLGRVYLKGLTVANARALLKSKFGQVYDLNNSQFDMSVTYSRTITVNVVGEVIKPGSYKLPAINTAFNSLIAAGGINDMGSLRNITIKRGGKVIQNLDVYSFLQNPELQTDFFLEDNDYIIVPVSSKLVEIRGAVKRPYYYELLETENLNDLILYSGGLAPGAYAVNVQIERFTPGGEKVVMDVNLDDLKKTKEDFTLTDGDKVYIKSSSDDITNFVSIEGAVMIPGRYELSKNLKISDLIKQAQGIKYSTYLDRGYLVRLNEDLTRTMIPFSLKQIINSPGSSADMLLKAQDIIRIFSNSDFADHYKIDVFGAVRNPDSFTYFEGMTLNDALFLVGGFKKEANNLRVEISRVSNFEEAFQSGKPTTTSIQTIEVEKDLNLSTSNANFKLQPFDQIFVRSTIDFDLQHNIELTGEVQYPGIYSLISKNEKISDVIKRAGGLTNWSFPQGASLFRTENNTGYIVMELPKVIKSESSIYNYELKNGDKIFIPQTIDFVTIKGAIQYPSIDTIGKINSPFIKGRRAKYYINEFGNGFDKTASKKRTYVIEPNGLVRKTKNFYLFKIYPRVEKGSTIAVVRNKEEIEKTEKEKVPIDWNKVIENTTVKITGLLTLLILVSRVL